jgi:hypothetical protein
MGDNRLSVKIHMEACEPMDMWINYTPDRKEEVLEAVSAYLDRAWHKYEYNMAEDREACLREQDRRRREADLERSRAELKRLQKHVEELEQP